MKTRRIIAVVHRGYSWYLPYVLRQVRAHNPRAEIVLFADRERLILRPFCRTVRIDDYFATARELEPFFENLSPNSAAYELFCLQRWAILLEYAKRHDVAEIVHLDSDVMVYCDLWETIDRAWAGYDFVATGFQGPQSLFIRNIAALQAFWDHIIDAYRHQLADLRTRHAGWLAQGLAGGVSDMHFLHEFIAAGSFRFGDNAAPVDGALFDEFINQANGFPLRDGIKHVTLAGDRPIGTRADDGATIAFNTLHFQGMTKKHIPGFSAPRSLSLPLLGVCNKLHKLGLLS